MIRFVGDDCKRALYDAIEDRQVRPGLCKTAGLKLVYSPLNGAGLVPVTQVLKTLELQTSQSFLSRSIQMDISQHVVDPNPGDFARHLRRD